MIINKLVLNNVGLFRGTQTIDLSPVDNQGTNKSIILIGGRNGVGKTTIFESIRLCLYGQSYDARNVSKVEYEAKLNDFIHKNKDGLHPTSAFVELDFSLTHVGLEEKYTIRRVWNRDASGITEKLILRREGEQIDDFDAAIWQDFLKEIIPPGISKLFFFDGEKIQQLAEDKQDREYVSDSFKSLLGLELLERLQNDLGFFIARELRGKKSNGTGMDLASILSETESLNGELECKIQERAERQASHDYIKGKVEELEEKIAGKGGDLVKDREKTKLTISKLDGEKQSCEQQIRDLCSDLLPFALAPNLCRQLIASINEESEKKKHLMYNQVLSKKLDDLDLALKIGKLTDGTNANLGESADLIQRLQPILKSILMEEIPEKDVTTIHDLSESERISLVSWLQTATTQAPAELHRLSTKFDELVEKQQTLDMKIKMAPNDEVLRPMLKELQDLNQSLGQVGEQMRLFDLVINTLREKLSDCQRRSNAARDHLKSMGALDTKLKLANGVIDVIGDYAEFIKERRISKLEETFRECFNKLSWKEDPIQRVRIDTKDFTVKLFDMEGNCVQKHMLSAGEKQVFAISMLWALTKASSRSLPFIIDTPLGRLDSEHRCHLVTDFFPNAGKQTIILSTDTEIDMKYFDELKPFIARSYLLRYQKKERSTYVTEGYFWGRDEA